ncbi:unnamed protein product [Symbiodinium sp. CCMP2456]|nr:unnamed protein product [Symbiodinium sp. CCMP2456]
MRSHYGAPAGTAPNLRSRDPLGPASASIRSGRPLATWIDELGTGPAGPAPAQSQVIVHKVSPRGAGLPWTCQICSQRDIGASLTSCPTCKRSRGTELRRSYMTAAELTESVVKAVNGGEPGELQTGGTATAPHKAQRHGTSPSRHGDRDHAATLPSRSTGSRAARVTFQDVLPSRGGPRPARGSHAWSSALERGHNDALDRHQEDNEAKALRPLRPLISSMPEAIGKTAGSRHAGAVFKEAPPPMGHMPELPNPERAVGVAPNRAFRGRDGIAPAGPPLPTRGEDWASASASFRLGAANIPQSAASSSAPAFFGGPHASGGGSMPRQEGVQPLPLEVPRAEPEVKVPRRLEKPGRMQETPVRSMAESASAPSVQARAKKPDIPDVNMDIEAVLEAQKRRIEGLKNKLTMTIA